VLHSVKATYVAFRAAVGRLESNPACEFIDSVKY